MEQGSAGFLDEKVKSLPQYRFRAGKPACPVACKYCFITEHDTRREVWNAQPLLGINRACTFLNVPPWIGKDPESQRRFYEFPWEVLHGDYVGFTAVTDPFWTEIEPWFWRFVESASPRAKLLTAVTKWPLTATLVKRLSRIPNFLLVVAVTGNAPPVERVPVAKHLRTLALAKEHGLKALPVSHPYISGVSDLSFLRELRGMGYSEFDVKGFRYCDRTMKAWLPESSRAQYQGREDEEILPEDGWREKVTDAGLSLLSPRQWYLREAPKTPSCSEAEAEHLVDRCLSMSAVVTSDCEEGVRRSAIFRRL